MRFYKHELSDTMFVEEDGMVYPFLLSGFEAIAEVIKKRDLSTYGGSSVWEIGMIAGTLSEMEEVTQEYEMKVSDDHIGGGTKSIGSGSGDRTPSPDWDAKWPDGDGKDVKPGV